MSPEIPTSAERASPRTINPYPYWTPRCWFGMRFGDVMALLARQRWRVHPRRFDMLASLLPVSLFNSLAAGVQSLIYGRRIAANQRQLRQAPIFVVGHFRTGTTFLYELMSRDQRFFSPNTFQCFAPHHFLLTQRWLPRLLGVLLPARRPMDNMAFGFDRPQEDEFALMAMGAPSPYARMAFPNEAPPFTEIWSAGRSGSRYADRIERALRRFYAAISLGEQRRLLVKSVPHTVRIAWLADRFPGARFVHIVRHPYDIYPSLAATWDAMDLTQALQAPPWPQRHIDEQILETFEQMDASFESQKQHLAAQALVEVRYEDLVAHPLTELEKIYSHLSLGSFAEVRPALEQYLESIQNYQPNRHRLEPSAKQQIDRRWSGYMARYGYSSAAGEAPVVDG